MKTVFFSVVFCLLVFWPPRKSEAKESVTQTVLNYQLTKNAILNYQIQKKIQKIEFKIDSIKNKK